MSRKRRLDAQNNMQKGEVDAQSCQQKDVLMCEITCKRGGGRADLSRKRRLDMQNNVQKGEVDAQSCQQKDDLMRKIKCKRGGGRTHFMIPVRIVG